MKITMRQTAAAGMVTLGLTGAAFAAVPAGATGPHAPADLSTIKARCDAAITQRQTTLTNLTAAVTGAKHLSDADRSALSGQLGAAASGLNALEGTIDADTTRAALATDCHRIVADYRIYLLVAPKTHLVSAADRGADAVEAANAARPKIDAAIAEAASLPALISPDKVADAKAKDADFTAKVADASALLSGVSDQLVPLTPQQYDDGTAKPVLDSARTKLASARADLLAARADLHAIRTDLTPVR